MQIEYSGKRRCQGSEHAEFRYIMINTIYKENLIPHKNLAREVYNKTTWNIFLDNISEIIYPNSTIVYPAQNYQGCTSSTIGYEKKHNPNVGDHVSKNNFIKIV